MPNLNNLYNNERAAFLSSGASSQEDERRLPDASYSFDVRAETEARQVHRQINKLLAAYKEEKRGPTVVVTQTLMDLQVSWESLGTTVGLRYSECPSTVHVARNSAIEKFL